ncbi:MAG: ABC transporter permease [Methylocystis sp.]
MNALDFDQAADETIRENDVSTLRPARERDEVVAALNLVSETATAIKAFEEQAAQALMRAQEVADAVREDLGRAELRAERAETMQRLSEAHVEQMSATIEQAHQEIEVLQSQLDSKIAELAASERRADDAEDAIERIMDVIRARTLPVN